MSVGIFLLILIAALLHAIWNAIIKFGDDKFQGMLVLSLIQGGIGVIMAMSLAWPQGDVWLWLMASGVIHSAYKIFLSYAYERGDLSRVYPIARGTAPMLVAVVGAFLLPDIVAAREYLGILLVGLGIVLMARGVFTQGESARMLPFALASALATAGYSLVDGMGARASGSATVFVAWMFAIDGAIFSLWGLSQRGTAVLRATPKMWGLGAAAGLASFGAYLIVVFAMTLAPIALVTALRETSVLFAVLIGVLFFREKADTGKLVAAALIVAGVVLTRI